MKIKLKYKKLPLAGFFRDNGDLLIEDYRFDKKEYGTDVHGNQSINYYVKIFNPENRCFGERIYKWL